MPRQSTGFLAVLCFASGFCTYRAHAQEVSAGDVLKKVAETYLRVRSFTLVAEKGVDADTDTGGEREVQTDQPPNVVTVGSRRSEYIQVTLMASGSTRARLLLKDGKKEIVVVASGNAVWTFIPAQHEYTELTDTSMESLQPVPAQVESSDISGVGLLREYETLIAARFQMISRDEPWAKLERSETLKVGRDKKECYVLTIQMPGGTQKQKLWVDKTQFTIWKSVDKNVGPWDFWGDRVTTTVTLTTKQLSLNSPLEETNFAFTPPDHAKRVDSLKLSGNPF